MLKKMLGNKKGFSLIELIVVIAILGVIAVIAVPAVMNTLKDSKMKADINSAQAIVKAVRQAHVALNSDQIATNDLADYGPAEYGLDTDLTNYIDLTRVPSSAPSTKFDLTISDASGADPTINVTFTENGVEHNIDKSGTDHPS